VRAPLFVFLPGANRPVRAHTFAAALGQRFELVSGPRTTLEGAAYYETNVLVTEPGYRPARIMDQPRLRDPLEVATCSRARRLLRENLDVDVDRHVVARDQRTARGRLPQFSPQSRRSIVVVTS